MLARTEERTVAALLVLLSLGVRCDAVANDCFCNQLMCEEPNNCSHGQVLDRCGCCMECARGLHEQCGGGPHGPGVCGVGLQCDINAQTGDVITGKELGVCRELSPECSDTACDSIVTHRCPADSVLVYNGTQDGSQCCKRTYECRCDTGLCKVPKCPQGHSPQVLRHNNGRPGSCCDQFQCKVSGCWSAGKLYKNLETWKDGDCVSCVCIEGRRQCQAEMCVKTCPNPKHVPGRCCPICDTPRLYPNQSENSKCGDLSICNITCKTGLQQTPDGCPFCKCKPEGCYKDCQYGYAYNETGVQTCRCIKMPTECPPLSACSKKCNRGYKLSKKGCPKCRCNKCPILECDKLCYLGYQRDKYGCKVCKCQESLWRTNCSVSGIEYQPDDYWLQDDCTVCICQHDGTVHCDPLTCPILSCPFMVNKEGQCCPVCLNISISHINYETLDNTSLKLHETSDQNHSKENKQTEIREMEKKYIISLSIVGAFVMILLILVFVLLYLKLKQRHQASWSVAGQDSYCKCPLFIGHSPTLQHKYNINGDIPNKLGYDTVVVQKFNNHPCIEVSLKSNLPIDEEKKNFISDEDKFKDSDYVSTKNNVDVKPNYSYNEWASM